MTLNWSMARTSPCELIILEFTFESKFLNFFLCVGLCYPMQETQQCIEKFINCLNY
jgi:hypothetical protein